MTDWIDRATRAEAQLAAVRERAESEIADAKAGETYLAEIDDGAGLMAEQARRWAWETVARLAATDRPDGNCAEPGGLS